MDVVDGKIVSAVENKRGSWSGAKRMLSCSNCSGLVLQQQQQEGSSSTTTALESSSFTAAAAVCSSPTQQQLVVGCVNSHGDKMLPGFLVEHMSKMGAGSSSPSPPPPPPPGPPRLVLSDDLLVDMQGWLAHMNCQQPQQQQQQQAMMPSCCDDNDDDGGGGLAPGVQKALLPPSSYASQHARPELDDGYRCGNAAAVAEAPSLAPVLKRQKSDGNWMPPAAAAAGELPISSCSSSFSCSSSSCSPPGKAAAVAADKNTALALVKIRESQQQRWENVTQQMDGLYVDPFAPLRKKMMAPAMPSPHHHAHHHHHHCPELLACCTRSSSPVSPSLPLLAVAKSNTTRCSAAATATTTTTMSSSGILLPAAVAAAYGSSSAMRQQLRTATSASVPMSSAILPHSIQPSSSSVFDAQCSSCVIPDIARGSSRIDSYGSAAAATVGTTSSCAMMMSYGFGSATVADDALSLTVRRRRLLGQENLREQSSSVVCSTRTDPMQSDSARRRLLHQDLSRHLQHSAGLSPLSCRVDGGAKGSSGSSPPPAAAAESGPIIRVVDIPAALSWASYSQTANSIFSTKPTQSRLWTEPLRFLLQKELTLTDVGELGRIILPKKDAESKLPQLDAKEGQFLQMEDYNSNRHWSLRFKWWPNNKSRMYVLESTGEFIKFYELKEKDVLTLYKDAEEKLVIRGQKSTPSFLRNNSISDPALPSCGKYTGRRSIKGVCSRGAAATTISMPTIATPSSALIQPRCWDCRGSGMGPATSSLVSEAKEEALEVKLENKVNSSSSGGSDGGILKKDTGSPPPPSSGHGSSSSGGKDKFLPLPGSIKPTHLDTKPLNYDLMLVPGVRVGQSAFAEVGKDHHDDEEEEEEEVVNTTAHNNNTPLGYLLQPDTGFDWGKLPDPPALELPSFKVEESWGDSMQTLRCLNISSSPGAFVQN